MNLLVFKPNGDLIGGGSCQFTKKHHYTEIQSEWNVELNKPWGLLIANIAPPFYSWNYNCVMRSGEQSLKRRLNSSA